jgi:hypothetical protein
MVRQVSPVPLAAARRTIRDGLKLWYKGKPPTYMQAQRPESDPVQQALMLDKLVKVLERRYFE